MYVHELGHSIVVTCKEMERDKMDNKMVVRKVVVQAKSKEGKDCMAKYLVA